MELCVTRAISKLPHHSLLGTNPSRLHSKRSLSLERTKISNKIPGLLYLGGHLLRATTSKVTSTSINDQVEEAPDEVRATEKCSTDEQIAPFEAIPTEVQEAIPPTGEEFQAFEFLDRLDIKLNPEDAYSILIYGSGALVALWLASAIAGAIDSIPVLPKALELVGLAFTIWFSSRNLIFKRNRDELLVKIEELKQQIIGSTED